MSRLATKRPSPVFGVMSPKPTVVTVTTAQYMPCGTLAKPCSGPSITYMSEPMITTIVSTVPTKIVILLRLWRMAVRRSCVSATKRVSFKIRNTRRSRSVRIAISDCAPGTSRLA